VNYDPRLVTAQRSLGAAWANAGDFEQALAALEAAVALEPDHAPTQYNLGIVHLYLGDVELARRAFEQVLALAPGSQWAKQAQDQLDQLNP
jgi:Flp pilus assembly protein TadD